MSELTIFSFLNNFVSLIAGVIGGIIGAYIISLVSSKSKIISVYNVNSLSNKEQRGEPMHGKGEPVTLKDSRHVWKWTNDVISNHSLLYGPYSQDLNQPGRYKIEFLLKGEGFPNDSTEILILDVTSIIYKRAPLYNKDGTPIIDDNNRIQTREYTESFRVFNSIKITKKDLHDGKWHKFSVKVFSSGSADLYEYRAREKDNYKLLKGEAVYFDTITVRRIG